MGDQYAGSEPMPEFDSLDSPPELLMDVAKWRRALAAKFMSSSATFRSSPLANDPDTRERWLMTADSYEALAKDYEAAAAKATRAAEILLASPGWSG